MKTDVLIIQHHAAEGPGRILDWLSQRQLSHQLVSPTEQLPMEDTSYVGIMLLGGPMSVHDDNPRLHTERRLLQQFIQASKPVLGICLGAQLIAVTTGHSVNKLPAPELGWQTIETEQGLLTVPQWHEDAINPGQKMQLWANSKLCQTQMFTLDDHILGLQFHPEWTTDSIRMLQQHFHTCPFDDLGTPAQHQALQSFFFNTLDRWWHSAI